LLLLKIHGKNLQKFGQLAAQKTRQEICLVSGKMSVLGKFFETQNTRLPNYLVFE
jgi:hypothetical protein